MKSQNHPVLATFALLTGMVLMAGAADIGPIKSEDINGPAWIGALAGAVFALAGLALLLRQQESVLGQLIGLLILLCFTGIGAWIALGPGQRECSGNFAGLLFDDVGDMPCRIVFGYGAIIVVAIGTWAATRLIQTIGGGPPAFTRTTRAGENLIILSLVPLLLIPLALIIIPAIFTAIKHRLKTGKWPRNENFRRKQAQKR